MSKIISSGQTLGDIKKERDEAEKAKQTVLKREKRNFDVWKAETMEDAEWITRDMHVATMMGNELANKYPGHGWEVTADNKNGVVYIRNSHMSGRYGYILKLADTNWAELSTQMMRIGGEVLRRFGIKKDRMDEDEILGIQRDFAGNTRFDLS